MEVIIGLIAIFANIYLFRRHLGTHYGETIARRITSAVFAGSLILSILPLIGFVYVLDDNLNSEASWQKVSDLDGSVSELTYEADDGLFAIMDNSEVRITHEIPFCMASNHYLISPSNVVLTESPRTSLPKPSGTVIQQISFDLLDPNREGYFVSSSFALYENGEVWCIEKFEGGGMEFGMSLGYMLAVLMVISAFIFVVSFFLLSILVVVILKVFHGRNIVIFKR